ncbi:MAG: hypothetical protein KC417_15095, partial [Myxococcales bacterium]|nr:hypothetical protein [Myxococcales bacterium]
MPHGFGGVWSARVVALTALALTAVALTAVATGCGAANSAVGGESTLRPVETALAGTSYDVRYFTEFDDVRDLAMGDAYVYAATARGLLVFEMGVAAAPRRVLRADGLPSDDATALHVAGDGSVYVATRAGVARWRKQIVDVAPAPPVGLVLSLATDASGSLWACGALGAAKRMGDGWALLADSTGCRSLTAAPGGRFWINTDHALLSVHGDVVREHGADSGVPALPLGSVVALDAHRLLATLPTAPARGSAFAYFDGARWSTHVLRGGSSSGGALVPDAAGALLLSAAGAHRVTARALRGAT